MFLAAAGVVRVGASVAGGTDTRALFNDGGSVGESASFTFNKTTGTLSVGSGAAAGRLSMGRDTGAAVAPGAGLGMLRWEAGTNAGTLKLMAYSGTSVTGVAVVDNVGGGN